MNGILYMVATPLGHLGDMTLRAIDVLKKVDRIYAEDTRHSLHLLKHYAIDKPLTSLHDFNERNRLAQVIQDLKQGQHIAVISDAGTPLISDPGFLVVREAQKEGIIVRPIPGPSAVIAALSVAGLPAHQFVFEGFLPPVASARLNRLNFLINEERTIVLYEAPHRLLALLESMMQVFEPDRVIVIAKELTKIHESIVMNTLSAHIDAFKNNPQLLRGEFVVLIAGNKHNLKLQPEDDIDNLLTILLAELPLKQAARLASQITGKRKNDIYELALRKKN